MNITSFSIIEKSDILNKDDFDLLTPLVNELNETFNKVQLFRTRTEMEVSVLNDVKFPTHASKYWQSVREQNVMLNELVMLSYEYRKNVIEIKILNRDMTTEIYEEEKELKQIEIDKKTFILKNQERTAKDRIREIVAWSEIKKREAKFMSEEELADVDNHQLISYTKRWINQSILMGNNGSPSERQNLLGQLRSGIIACIDKGILDETIKEFAPEIQKQIIGEYNDKILANKSKV